MIASWPAGGRGQGQAFSFNVGLLRRSFERKGAGQGQTEMRGH
jgi:hypothetical protein